ncbi:glycosyl transferase family 2 [Yoonia maritima]|uniref:Glycosyl transferase family 2 n=2 Tax=Yoonia maritima TaxID=1435347 RepID=A0A2T0W333_9RHOB|nr:glycosyl transferase family 2 [Yoonia maritima]
MMSEPSIVCFTVMKNEGPFIIEWVAYQRLIGVNKVIVLSNDSDDGTDDILNRLDDLGYVRHLPNPSMMSTRFIRKQKHPHIVGFNYATLTREWKEADYVLMCDVDEFPVIKVGDGSLHALLKKTEFPDVISMNTALYGVGGNVTYKDELITKNFNFRTPHRPGEKKSGSEVKSLTRNDPDMFRVANHRPMVLEENDKPIRWVDGAGNDFSHEFLKSHEKRADFRGRDSLAVVNHYSLRSVESFLVKSERGDAVMANRDIDHRYFNTRNRNHDENKDIHRMLPQLEALIAELKTDAQLAGFHDASVVKHQAKIEKLKSSSLYENLCRIVGVRVEGGQGN